MNLVLLKRQKSAYVFSSFKKKSASKKKLKLYFLLPQYHIHKKKSFYRSQ